MDIRNLNYPNGTIDEIFASDILEHISHLEVEQVLKSWCDLLKPGGKIYLRVPDARKQAELLLSGIWDMKIYRYMVFGGQETPGNFHCTAFDSGLLESMLLANNIEQIKINLLHHDITKSIKTSSNPNLEIQGQKKC